MTTISDGQVVSIQYTLRSGSGDVLDQSEADEPLIYLHGADNIVPGLEKQLTGMAVGAKADVVVAPEDGYGPRSEGDPHEVPRDQFPPEMPIEPGVGFATEGAEGQMIPLWILKVEGDTVFVDTNHPLAGQTLHFNVEVTAIRDATDDEKAHGHPHGPTGHEGHGH